MSFIKWMFISIIIIGIFIGLGYGIVEIIDLVRSIGENGLKIEALREPLRGISLAVLELAVLGEGYIASKQL